MLGILRDISLIVLIVPALLCLLVPAVMAFGAWWVTYRVHRAAPARIRSVRHAVRRTRDALDTATRALTKPLFFRESQAARWRAMWRALRERSG